MLAVYLSPIVLVLSYFDFWNLKDFLFWLFGVGFVLIFKTNDAKNSNYFKRIILEAIKITAVFEFILNSYTFGLITELILVPITIFIVLLQVIADKEDEFQIFSNAMKVLLGILSIILLSYSIYYSITDYKNFYSVRTGFSFIFPLLLTAIFIPFLYFIALYSRYESFFVRLDFMANKRDEILKVKNHIIRIAGGNLNKLDRIIERFDKKVFYEKTNLKKYIRTISKK